MTSETSGLGGAHLDEARPALSKAPTKLITDEYGLLRLRCVRCVSEASDASDAVIRETFYP